MSKCIEVYGGRAMGMVGEGVRGFFISIDAIEDEDGKQTVEISMTPEAEPDNLVNLRVARAEEFARGVLRACAWLRRQEGLRTYGGAVCVCCGATMLDALVLDQIESTGADEDLEDIKTLLGQQEALYKNLQERGWPSGYQVMCANCHVGRGKNLGVCPHKASA